MLKSKILEKLTSRTSAHHFRNISKSSATDFTHIIVGAGSAGCVLANRLTENSANNVLLVEAGPKDYSWKIHMPAALMYNLCDDKYNWFYHTTPQKWANNRVMYWPRGRVWGGSSSLNAMVYVRGHAYDLNRWEQEGATNWAYKHCLPYYKKSQTHELGEDSYRGGSGPLHVSRGRSTNPLFEAFIEAGKQAGFPFTDDMNGFQQEGVGWMDMTVHKGIRWSTANGYLRPALKRPNLTTVTRALVSKVLFKGKKAIGIEYQEKASQKKVYADEVILSGGAINTPQLLLLSGVGDGDHLKDVGIDQVHHLPGVGQNLQDHLELYVNYACRQPITLYKAQWKFPHYMIRTGVEWLLRQTGDGASSHLEAGGFIRSRPGVTHPDIQFHFLPGTVVDHGRKIGDEHAYQVHVGTLRPTSKGALTLKTANPRDHPIIEANYLSTEQDRLEMRLCVKHSRELMTQKAFDEFRAHAIQPGDDVQSDAELDAFVREHCDSAYHPSCTCKMGSSVDAMAVVDPVSMGVLGLESLRVIDASVMPSVVSGNLNATVVMLAEKAADLIQGKKMLAPFEAPVWKPASLEEIRSS